MLCGEVLGAGLLIFGGVRGRNIFGDLWHFGFKTNMWTKMKKADATEVSQQLSVQ
jgi:hypothetical protein